MLTTRTTTLAAETMAQMPELFADEGFTQRFEQVKQNTRTVQMPDGAGSLYVVEGDLLYDEDELKVYTRRKEEAERAAKMGLAPLESPTRADALVVVAPGGRIVRWRPGKVLTYAVLRTSFLSQDDYDRVVEGMAAACGAWQDTCGIEFQHLSEHDDHADVSASPDDIADDLVFSVRFIDAGGQFIASAFFPTLPPARRRVLIDPSYFTPELRFDRTGVLRHELGHVLGFRHEHIRTGAPAACPDEPTYDTMNLTDYDPRSVMHYFCGNVGSADLAITELDRQGAQRVYGLPSSSLLVVD